MLQLSIWIMITQPKNFIYRNSNSGFRFDTQTRSKFLKYFSAQTPLSAQPPFPKDSWISQLIKKDFHMRRLHVISWPIRHNMQIFSKFLNESEYWNENLNLNSLRNFWTITPPIDRVYRILVKKWNFCQKIEFWPKFDAIDLNFSKNF